MIWDTLVGTRKGQGPNMHGIPPAELGTQGSVQMSIFSLLLTSQRACVHNGVNDLSATIPELGWLFFSVASYIWFWVVEVFALKDTGWKVWAISKDSLTKTRQWLGLLLSFPLCPSHHFGGETHCTPATKVQDFFSLSFFPYQKSLCRELRDFEMCLGIMK